jgi:hypothetical protein
LKRLISAGARYGWVCPRLFGSLRNEKTISELWIRTRCERNWPRASKEEVSLNLPGGTEEKPYSGQSVQGTRFELGMSLWEPWEPLLAALTFWVINYQSNSFLAWNELAKRRFGHVRDEIMGFEDKNTYWGFSEFVFLDRNCYSIVVEENWY